MDRRRRVFYVGKERGGDGSAKGCGSERWIRKREMEVKIRIVAVVSTKSGLKKNISFFR